MNLTKTELEIADRWISKREKQLAKWPRRRWLMVVIYSVVALVGYQIGKDGMRSIQDDKATDLEIRRELGDGPIPGMERRWVVGAMLKIGKLHELRYQIVTASLMQVAWGYLELALGLIMVCLVILRWNTGERDALICKLLRANLQEIEKDAAPSFRPPSLPSTSTEIQPSNSQRTTSL